MNYQQFFKGKRVTLMGLGLLGRGLGDAVFLAEHGAELTVTDLRDAKILAPSLAKLKKYNPVKAQGAHGAGNIRYTLGLHKLEDFRNRDFIVKAAGVPLDSPYIAEAKKRGVPVEMDASLFAKLIPKGVTLVGVTGTRGKSTVTALIYETLSSSPPFLRGSTESARGRGSGVKDKGLMIKDSPAVFRGGNLVPEATLPLLEKVKSGDIVVLELDSWQLQGFHDAKLSPQVAVFTTFLDDHLIYYKGDTDRYFEDKVAIFKYQKSGDLLIAGERVAENIGKSEISVKGDFVVARKEDVPSPPAGGWKIPLLGEHNLENIACALAVAKYFNIPEAVIKRAVEHFKPVPGRLEYIRTVRGIKIYNDNNATTPDATIAALRALSPLTKGALPSSAGGLSTSGKTTPASEDRGTPFIKGDKNIILIIGGTDKVLGKHDALVDEISKSCKAAILLKETGTNLIKPKLEALRSHTLQIKEVDGLKSCVEEAMRIAKKGNIVLFSPAFASFGKWFKNEYDRGEQFAKLIEKL